MNKTTTKMLDFIVANGNEKLILFIEEHSNCYSKGINDIDVLEITECFIKGGPGSGCHGDNCGRSTGSRTKPSANDLINTERFNIGPKVTINEGGSSVSSRHREVTEVQPRKLEHIEADHARANDAVRLAEETYRNNRTTENRYALNKAKVEARKLEREAVAARIEAERRAGKKE